VNARGKSIKRAPLTGNVLQELSRARTTPADTNPEPELARSTSSEKHRSPARHTAAIENKCGGDDRSCEKMTFHLTSEEREFAAIGRSKRFQPKVTPLDSKRPVECGNTARAEAVDR
jgi:hypothetical protein